MNKYEEAVRQLQKGIETYVDKKISETKFDKTYIGIITAVTDNNTYSVNVKNVVYNNVPVAGNAVCKLNEIVKVLVPMSNFNNMFIINVNNDYVNNINKPTINGVEINGNLTSEDLHISVDGSLGIFGGWVQSKDKYFNNENGFKNVGMSPNNDRYALWAGETNKKNGLINESNAYFKLRQNGNLVLNSDNVIDNNQINKGNLFIDFTPQNKDEMYSIYYQQSSSELGKEEFIRLYNAYPIKIEHDMVYIPKVQEDGTIKIEFDPEAYFAELSGGLISRVSRSLVEQFSEMKILQDIIADYPDITKNTVGGQFGVFNCVSTFDRSMGIERTVFTNNYNGLTIGGSTAFPSLGSTMYLGTSIDDTNRKITFKFNAYSPIYWAENPSWDSRIGFAATTYITNSNFKNPTFNCFVSKSGSIYSKKDTFDNNIYYIFRMNCAPCNIPNYDEKLHKTVFDLTEKMRGKIVCFGNGTGSIPEFQNNENDIDLLRNFIVVKKLLYISRNNDLVLNAPKIKSSISLFDEQISKAQMVLNLNKEYLIDIGRLTKITNCPDYINAIHFEEGFDNDNNWQRKVIIETDKLVLKTKDGEVELGVKEDSSMDASTENIE